MYPAQWLGQDAYCGSPAGAGALPFVSDVSKRKAGGTALRDRRARCAARAGWPVGITTAQRADGIAGLKKWFWTPSPAVQEVLRRLSDALASFMAVVLTTCRIVATALGVVICPLPSLENSVRHPKRLTVAAIPDSSPGTLRSRRVRIAEQGKKRNFRTMQHGRYVRQIPFLFAIYMVNI